MSKLELARGRIDAIDREMARLYQERMEAVKDVLQYKQEHGLPVLDVGREEKIIEKNRMFIQEPAFLGGYEKMLRAILEGSRQYQQERLGRNVVACQGVEGAFSSMAADELFPTAQRIMFNEFEDVFKAVLDGRASVGVIPFENTNSGLVGEVLDLLLEYPVYIRQIKDQAIEQVLLGVSGASLKDVEWVYSKDQALNQARGFLQALGARAVPYPNTALAAQYVARENDKSKAAIGAKENAALYGLDVLCRHVEENATNTTRFLVIGRQPALAGDRFSIIVTVHNRVGALQKVIETLSRHGMNLCSIQSRPRKGHPFEYFFFIESEGQLHDWDVVEAELSEVCEQIKVLGQYGPAGKES